MNYEFENPNKYAIQISGPNKEIIKLSPGQKKILSDYFLKYCPKYIRKIDANVPTALRRIAPRKNIATKLPKSSKSSKSSRSSRSLSLPIKKIETPKINNEIIPEDIGIGILSCNRLNCVKRLLESIKKYTDISKISIIVSDESTTMSVKNYLRSIKWIKLIDNNERLGVVHNTNKLLQALTSFKYKLILNDDVTIKSVGWERFYFDAMISTKFHHYCYRELTIYGANEKEELIRNYGKIKIKTITSKPQGAVMAFDDLAFKKVGFYDTRFPRYGMAHVDWSNRVSNSGIQLPGFHDVEGSDKFFRIHDEKTVEANKHEMLRNAKKVYKEVDKVHRIYVPLTNIDPSDIHIVINTYNRPDLLDQLLVDIETQKKNHNISIFIYDDASEKDYDAVIKKHSNLTIKYHKTKTNYGKRKYWELVNLSFTRIKSSKAQYFIKLDDDVRLIDNFFDICINYWHQITDPRKICLNPLLDELRKGKPVWSGKNPKIVKFNNIEFWNAGWVDMMFFCEKSFFRELDFNIKPVPLNRWIKDPDKSSGVGAQISERLTNNKLSMYQPGHTLLIHKDHKSQMHENLRKNEPITSVNDKITISMAAIDERINHLEKVIDSLRDQCDEFNVYLNDTINIPKFLKDKNINVFEGVKLGNIGDIGKFYPQPTEGYIFTVDDDLIYPSDYVSTMISKIEQYNRKCCIGVHGAILKKTVKDYYKDRTCLHYRFLQQTDINVHIIGTGTLAYHSSTINPSLDIFKLPNMADIWFALLAQKLKIGMRCIARPKEWIKDVGIDAKESIHGRKTTLDKQNNLINSIKWKLY